jgi:hypothetical protein
MNICVVQLIRYFHNRCPTFTEKHEYYWKDAHIAYSTTSYKPENLSIAYMGTKYEYATLFDYSLFYRLKNVEI